MSLELLVRIEFLYLMDSKVLFEKLNSSNRRAAT